MKNLKIVAFLSFMLADSEVYERINQQEKLVHDWDVTVEITAERETT